MLPSAFESHSSFRSLLLSRRDHPALEFQGATYTFGDIDARSNRLAQLLASRGLKTGDRLCVYLANCLEMIDLYLACVKLGVIFVPINILYRERELTHILTDAEPAAVVSATPLPERRAGLESSGSHTRSRRVSRTNGRTSRSTATRPPASSIPPAPPASPKAPSSRTITSPRTRSILLTCWQISSADRFLLTLPLFHVHGLGNGLHCWLISGCRMRLLERFEHQKAAAEFLDFRPTLFFGVPAMYVRLLDFAPEQAREIGGFVRLFVSGSAPLPAQIFEEFRERFGHAPLERYGMSETLMNISNPYSGERRPGSVGLPLPGVSVRLLDPEGRPVADGEPGEVHLKGPTSSRATGGAKTPRARLSSTAISARAISPRARPTATTLCAAARATSSFQAASTSIQGRSRNSSRSRTGVAEAAVAAAPDRVRGEVPVAYVVAAGGVDPRISAAISKPLAAKNSRHSKFRARSSWSTSCPATRSAKSRNTS